MLIAASLVTAWVLLQLLLLGGLSHARAQAELYDQFRSELAQATVPTGGVIDPGTPVALLVIPQLGLRQVVVEGTSGQDLAAGPGHRRDTPLPGQEGVSLVYGKSVTAGAPFAGLAGITAGQHLTVTTQQGQSLFTVEGVRRPGDPLPDPLEPGQARLTLETAEATHGMHALRGDDVVYVDAILAKGDAFVAPPDRLPVVSDAEQAMASDTSTLPLLVVALAGLVAVVAATGVAHQRWGRLLVWTAVLPVLLALAWQCTALAAPLLPNLL